MPRKVLPIVVAALLLAGSTLASRAQEPSETDKESRTQSTETLEFLGSYSAPSAISATETGHVSAHPLSPPTGRRLRQIDIGPSLLPPWPLDVAWGAEDIARTCKSAGVSPRARRAQQAAEARNFMQAEWLYAELARDAPGCAPLRWNWALMRAYARQPRATDDLGRGLDEAPSPSVAHLTFGLAKLARGDLTAARAELGSVIPSGIKNRDDVWAKAVEAWASDRLSDSREFFLRLTEIEPDDAAAWFALGGVSLEEARAASRRLAETAPKSSWNRLLESQALAFHYPELAKAIRPNATSQASSNRNPPIAQANSDRLHPEVELRRLNSLPESPEVLYGRARAALAMSELAYGKARCAAFLAPYFCALGALAAEEEHHDSEAEREYLEGLRANPSSAVLHAGLGHLYRRRLQLVPARRELEEAWKQDPTDPLVAFELGDVYLRLNESKLALEVFNRALENDPALWECRWSRAKAYLALGDDRRALTDLEAAAPADNSGEVEWQLAALYRKLGRHDLARSAEERSEQQRHASQKQAAGSSQ